MRLLGLACVIAIAGTAVGADIIPLSEVRPGMTGYGLTVVAGTQVSRFEVEVVGVLDEPGDENDFIIVRAYGDAIDRSGGIAQGMSGSPVYLDGRLAGALSRAALWSADPHRPLGLVTPIETMLAVLDEVKQQVPPEEPPEEIPIPKELEKLGLSRLKFVARPPDVPEPGVLYSWPLTAPVMASGFSPRALEVLAQGLDLGLAEHPFLALLPGWRGKIAGLSDFDLGRIVQAPSAPQDLPALPFSPGAPVGVGLLTGDITLGALGTVTLVEEGAVLAFGHPFLFSGRTDYFLTSAYVFDTVAALDAPYKLGTIGEVEGAILADRWAAIGGLVGRSPQPVALDFSVWDEDRGQGTRLAVSMVREARLEALLFYVAGLEATDRALDRIGPGTVSVHYRIEGDDLPRPLERHNVFLSTQDVALYVPWEAAIVTDILEYNEFADPGLLMITLDASITPELSAIRIVDLEVDKDRYAPGDTIQFTVHLQDWRGEGSSWSGELPIPEDLDTPYLELRAYGGPRPVEKGEGVPIIASLSDLIDYLEGVPSYDTLTVELFALDPVSELMGEPWMYGVSDVSASVGEAVVYDEVSLIIPFGAGG